MKAKLERTHYPLFPWCVTVYNDSGIFQECNVFPWRWWAVRWAKKAILKPEKVRIPVAWFVD